MSGNDHAVVFAGSQFNFQLDAYKPVMLHDVLDLEQFLAEGLRSFNEHCTVGIAPNEERTKEHLDNLLMLALALNRL